MTEPSEPRPEDVAEALRSGRRPSDLPGAQPETDPAGSDGPVGVEPVGSEVPPDLPEPGGRADGSGP